jgi:hypothetical protein
MKAGGVAIGTLEVVREEKPNRVRSSTTGGRRLKKAR